MSDCNFTLVATIGRIKEYHCSKCGFKHHSIYDSTKYIHRNCTAGQEKPTSGPGTRLFKILRFLGFEVWKSCSCEDWVDLMNVMGKEWCRSNRSLIVDQLERSAKKKLIVGRFFSRRLATILVWIATR